MLRPIQKVFGSHNYDTESRYLHLSNVIQICYLNFSRKTNPQKYVDSKRSDQFASKEFF